MEKRATSMRFLGELKAAMKTLEHKVTMTMPRFIRLTGDLGLIQTRKVVAINPQAILDEANEIGREHGFVCQFQATGHEPCLMIEYGRQL